VGNPVSLPPLAWDDAIERTGRAERLEAAFTILVDPQRDPDSISLAARLAGAEVLSPADVGLVEGLTYDPLALTTTSRTANPNQD
jgi:hypothetical protein